MAVVDRMYQCFAQGDMETLKNEVFAPDIEWALPGHHPLSGVKLGADEVIAFFALLMQTGISVDNISFGTIGDESRLEYTVIGDTVNTAKRLCSAAQGGEILVTSSLRQRLTRTHDLADHAPLEIQSRPEPLPVYRIIR